MNTRNLLQRTWLSQNEPMIFGCAMGALLIFALAFGIGHSVGFKRGVKMGVDGTLARVLEVIKEGSK